MNIQIGDKGINWTDATWNPVTGCLHGCPYCYARALADRFGRSFEPAFHPERLDQPLNHRQPLKVFVGSNADLFGDWVPESWVLEILNIVRRCPQHTFQFLTKAPHNLSRYNPWPDNCWLGATATDQPMMDRALVGLSACDAPVRFISAEPLLGLIDCDLSRLDWLIIGAQTGPGGHQPEPAHVTTLLSRAADSGSPVFFKDNLAWSPRLQQWPLITESPQSRMF